MDYAEYYVNISRKKRAGSFVIFMAIGIVLTVYAISSAGVSALFPGSVTAAEEFLSYTEESSDGYRPYVNISFEKTVPLGAFGVGSEAGGQNLEIYVTIGYLQGRPVPIITPDPVRNRPPEPLNSPHIVSARRSESIYAAIMYENSDKIVEALVNETEVSAAELAPYFEDGAFCLDYGNVTHSGSVALILFGAGLVLFCIMRIGIIRLRPLESDPFIKSLNRLGAPVEIRERLNREIKEPVMTAEYGDITDSFIIGVRRAGFNIGLLNDLVFAYELRTPQRERTSGRTPVFAVACHFMDGKMFYLLAESATLQDQFLNALKLRAPHALFNEVEKLKSEWRNDRENLIRRVRDVRDGVGGA